MPVAVQPVIARRPGARVHSLLELMEQVVFQSHVFIEAMNIRPGGVFGVEFSEVPLGKVGTAVEVHYKHQDQRQDDPD